MDKEARQLARLLAKVRMSPAGCWEWMGKTDWVLRDGRRVLVHRLVWRVFYGRDPVGRVDRRCGDRRCVRPDHLYLAGDDVGMDKGLTFLRGDGDVLVGMLEGKTISQVSSEFEVPIRFVEGIVFRLRERDRRVAVEAYLAGSTIKGLSERFGVSLRVMNAWLKDVKRRRATTVNERGKA